MVLKIIKYFRRKLGYNVLLVFLTAAFVYAVLWNSILERPDVAVNGQLYYLDKRNGTRRIQEDGREGVSYNSTTAMRHANKSVDKHGCEEWFEDSLEENLKHIARYPRGSADDYMHKIAENLNKPKSLLETFPVIATAANSGFYGVSQGLIKSVYEILLPKYQNITIVYYDMGLTVYQRKQLKQYCTICEVRIFPFDDFPEHVRKLKTYAWKPIIVKTLLLEFGWVWWMDSSVRFITNDLDRGLKYSQDNSILFFTYGVVFAVARHTDIQTMQYFGEDRCKFRHFGEVEATFVLFHFDDVTNILVDQWAACALSNDCIAPDGTDKKLSCRISNRYDGRCHRFDQAVLSILLRRLYHEKNDYPLVPTPFHIHEIKRGNAISYFPK
ncbi:uncharacterized protein LOC123542163 [Mercenaria mercenaria]|uniref:uncharacterized protein LOC123542163 n=1 Tax=Mercenaria mercenaria TaxID=6596 RepID=UPI00234EAE19|nr:uncharacterized protein LOC123542163 [Mercenaria mercenaria]XP_045183783.2 uncharacterized protein LOC123542163 [Mercenaria mercenaria]XP_053386847.1 uncharacterized protein LOC123542163 [Mercenaria mercenaria]XP_053386848.1 uncharacterized protein LOC123542163 [Mercenaria mercenaria]